MIQGANVLLLTRYSTVLCMWKGLPAAFASAAFGTFLDQKRSGGFTTAACQTVLRLITILSDSYIDTINESVFGQLKATLGPQFAGEIPGREKSMLSLVHEELLYYFQQVMTPDICFMTLEPSLTSGVSCANLTSSSRICHFTCVLLRSGHDLYVCMHPCVPST